ncbi:hypothetical protein J2Y74_000942 [Pseudomonas migulae]|nr:hypothetical protein [Pseudomonas migulae]
MYSFIIARTSGDGLSQGLPTFGGVEELTYNKLANLLHQGAELYSTTLTEGFGWEDYRALHGERAALLFARNDSGWVHVATPDSPLKPSAGWSLLALIQPQASGA